MQLQSTEEMLTLIGGLIVAYFVYVLISRKNDKPSTDPPAMAHAALREIVERAVEEARKLPGLNASSERLQEERAVADNSYEDLLATAILNKVIEKYQRERIDGNSNVLHDTNSHKTKYTANESEHGLEEDAASYASDRLECNGDHSASNGRNEDHKPMSFTMEERIEEVTTITDDELRENDALEFGCTRRVPFPECGMDIVDPPRELPSPSSSSDSSDLNNEYPPIRTKRHAAHTMDIVSPIESWEDNWLFQKKSSRSQADAVAMLVPSSNAYYKALIGDQDAEDTSDLSECSSTKSDEEIEKELMEAINNVIPRTPRLSESDTINNQIENHQEETIKTQFVKNEVNICQATTKTEKNKTVCTSCDEKNHEKRLKSSKMSEEKTDNREDDKEKRNKSSFILITEAKEEDKEKSKGTTECNEKTIATTLESSAQKEVKMQSEKSNEKSNRGENVTDENEEQRESEYTEHYDTAIQRHLDSLTKVEICSEENEMADEMRKTTNEQLRKSENNSTKQLESERSIHEAEVQLPYVTIDNKNCVDIMNENDPLSTPPRPGTIAEREHKKWENAPPIENNPYSEESIRKRCLEKQYSKNSDIPGAHYELTKLNEVSLETLTPGRSDIKRFGRDYYINQSKAASGERQERSKSAISSSRPSSSLSQQSSCAGDEQHERQEEQSLTSKEIDGDISVLQVEKDTKTSVSWHKNNAEVISPETNNRAVNSRFPDDRQKVKVKSEKDAPNETTWKDRQHTDDILENQRKNSKNEINAKLNNQEQNIEAEHKDAKERKVRRIDLKAYGFENEFSDQKKPQQIQQQRMVNRLDLSSFGYLDGLRRTRSNNQLDQPLRNNEKSNLTRRGYLIDTPRSLGYKNFAKSSRGLNELRDEVEEVNSRLLSAKSMPNVAEDICYYANPVYVNDTQDELTAKNLLDLTKENAMTEERDVIVEDDISLLNDYDEISSDIDRSFEDIYIRTKAQSRETNEELQVMPSVKKLAEAFGRQQTSETKIVPTKVYRASVAKVDESKDTSTIPEVHIVETPKQMHSLTARSLSREFREGLRQMPGKLTSPPVSRSLMEEQPMNRTEIVRSKQEVNDTAIISPGKLKSNIIFWEQMQKRS